MEFVEERIWKPLNMTSTTFYESVASADGQLTQSWTIGGRRIPYWEPDEQISVNAGPGGIISNVVDMVCFCPLLASNQLAEYNHSLEIMFYRLDPLAQDVDERGSEPRYQRDCGTQIRV